MSFLAALTLSASIISEISGTMSLRMATQSSRWWWLGVVTGYVLAFSLLASVLSQGVALGVAYGIWSAAGVAITALLSKIFFKEPLNWVMALGIVVIMGGVLLIETGAAH